MGTPLVSVMTPCYNTGILVNRLLDSLLMQDYPNLELFAIDDGSIDNTKEVISSYRDAFLEKGYSFNYLFQENSGQSVAINNGLKYVKGKYLLWPDSDDYYIRPDAISLLVRGMEKDTSIPLMRAAGNVVDESTGNVLKVLGTDNKNMNHKNDFEDCLFTRNGYYYQPVCYILRLSSLRSSTQFPIYTSKSAGQNWQLMLPVLYNQQIGIIPEVICNILERKSSHSRIMKQSYEKEILGKRTYRDTIIGTLNRIIVMNDEERNYYINHVKEFYLRKEIEIDYSYDQYNSFLKNYALYKKQYPANVNPRMRLWYYMNLTRTSKLLKKLKSLFII